MAQCRLRIQNTGNANEVGETASN